jgi:aspartate/methionine/tyrosine aminotransferase
MDEANPTGLEAVEKYEQALLEAEMSGTKTRALLLASPHNPLGRCYTVEALQGYLKLCAKYSLHLISDEIYAMEVFASKDVPEPKPLVSVLSFDVKEYIDPSLVHVAYGMSKDFCSNGLRVGALISPWNPDLLAAFATTAVFPWPSSMSDQTWTSILGDEAFLPSYFETLTNRLAKAYDYCVAVLKEQNIPYAPVSAGPFIWVDLSSFLAEQSAEAELDFRWKMIKGGVWLALGNDFSAEKPGCYRLTFAIPEPDMEVGMKR